MRLFAITYTDPSEPWGHAVEDGKLYSTPTALVDAWNAHFDAWWKAEVGRWTPAVCTCPTVDDVDDLFVVLPDCECTGTYAHMTRREDLHDQWTLYYKDSGQSFEDYLVDEYRREYGVASYQVVA